MIASLAGDILLSQVNSKGTQNHTQCSKRAGEVSLLLSSTSTVISLATYIIQRAHKWTDSGRQWCHFTLTSYYTVNIESFTANGKTSIWTTWPRFCHLLFNISTHKKVVSCHVHPQKVFWTIFVFSFSNLRNFQLESEDTYICNVVLSTTFNVMCHPFRLFCVGQLVTIIFL